MFLYLIMIIRLGDTSPRKYPLHLLMLQYLEFPKCLLPYGFVGIIGGITMMITIIFMIAIKESNQSTTMTSLTQETGLISMIILRLQRHLINILTIKSSTLLQEKKNYQR